MKNLEAIFLTLGLDQDNGLYKIENERWKAELALPNRVRRLLERKIRPDAFFCFDGKPLILFFNNPADVPALHKAIWNFNECPVVILVQDNQVEIFNGFRYDLSKEALERLGGTDQLNDFSYFELVTGRAWEKRSASWDLNNRVDYHLLQNIKAAREVLLSGQQRKAKLINAILGKIIFVRYLIDRKVKMRFDGRLRTWTNTELCDLLDQPGKVQKFFSYLEDSERGFNGDLFPISTKEYSLLTKKDYSVLKRLLQGEDIAVGQPSLFELYDFSIIPIEFISNVYELFIGKENQKKEGVYYTPLFLVDYMLKETVECSLSNTDTIQTAIDNYLDRDLASCKVLDPACGSGIFLVESLRKIIERFIADSDIEIKSEKFKTAIKNLARQNIYGIDKDESAIQVAIFSIYLTLLDYLEPPGIETFKFPVLLNTNFFVADFFDQGAPFNTELEGIEFDFILGNPPWEGGAIGKFGKSYLQKRRSEEQKLQKKNPIAINNGEIAEGFMLRVSDFAKSSTQIALIIKSTILYNKGYTEYSKFRQYWLEEFFIDRIFELAPVRHEIFDRSNDPAIAPAAVVFYRYARGASTAANIVQHITLKPSRFFSLFKVFTLTRADYKKVEQDKLKKFDFLWKILVYGSYLDFNFIHRLLKDFESVQHILSDESKFITGTGVTFSKNPEESSGHLRNKPFVESYAIEPHFINPKKIGTFQLSKVGRRRNDLLFKGPLLLVRNGLDTESLTARAAIHTGDIVYKKALTGIKPLNGNLETLRNIAGMLSSTLYSYLAIQTFNSIGIEREQTKGYEKFNVPYLTDLTEHVKTLEGLKVKLFQENHNTLPDPEKITILKSQLQRNGKELDDTILSGISATLLEKDLIDYSLHVTRPMITHSHEEKLYAPVPLESELLEAYANVFIKRFASTIAPSGKKFVVEVWHTHHMVGMFFKTINGDSSIKSIRWVDKKNDDQKILSLLIQISSSKITDRLFIQKDVRGFETDHFYIFKPNEEKLWHKAIAHLDSQDFADAMLRAGKIEA